MGSRRVGEVGEAGMSRWIFNGSDVLMLRDGFLEALWLEGVHKWTRLALKRQ